MKIYNKLVRDRIPEIIFNSGKECNVVTLNDRDYIIELNKKLIEEVNEYQESQTIEELADIVEVIYAILDYKGVSKEKLEKMRLEKVKKRGEFRKKLFLIDVSEKNE